MSLKQNGRLLQQMPLRFRGGAILSFEYQDTNKSSLRNIFAGEAGIDPRNGTPVGYLSPSSWILPQKSGGMSSLTSVEGQGTFNAMGALGRNIDAILAGEGTLSGELILVVSALANLAGSGLFVGNLSAELEAVATIVASGDLNGSIVALGDAIASLNGSGTMTAGTFSTGNLAAEITPFVALSPQSLANAVWSSTSTQFTTPGTMGEKMNNAGDAEFTANSVWDELMSTHTVAGSFSERVQKLLTLSKFIGLK